MRPYAGISITGRPFAGVSLLGGRRRRRSARPVVRRYSRAELRAIDERYEATKATIESADAIRAQELRSAALALPANWR